MAGLPLVLCVQAAAATFGSVVVIGGHAADIAFDQRRGQVYIANFAGRRIDVLSASDNTLRTPIPMTTVGESGSLALSPDGRYLVITNYANCSTGTTPAPCSFLASSTAPMLTVIDLDASVQSAVPIPQPSGTGTTPRVPLTVAFGSGMQALLVTSSAIYLVDPTTNPPAFNEIPLPTLSLSSQTLPVTFGTYPPQILQASSGVSGDGNTIYVLAQGGGGQGSTATGSTASGAQVLLWYYVPFGALSGAVITSSPQLGPRIVSPNYDGTGVLAGWSLLNQQIVLMAEFPSPTGALNLGGHAWDYVRNRIYAQIPSGGPADPPVLHVLDTDNLTVRERIQLPENLAGKAIFSSDMNTLYAISDSGVTVLPVGSLDSSHRVTTVEEQLLFQANSCGSGPITQTLDVVDRSGGATDFTLSVPTGTKGVNFSQRSGTTPAQVIVSVDPTAYQSANGTSVVPVTIQSSGSVGIPNGIRLLINTKNPDQRGVIHPFPGTIVDLASDAARGRLYALRQDLNQLIVMDSASFNVIAILRTGNTPTKLAFTRDNRYLMVGNDNSQIASVFDLNTLKQLPPIVFPPGHYPRSIAAANSSIFAVSRVAGTPPGVVDQIDFANGVASTPATLGVFTNNVSPDSVVTASPSGQSIFMAGSDGTVLIWDDTYHAFEAGRKDVSSLGGSYAAASDDLYLAGGILFNRSMVQMGPLTGVTATSSVLILGNEALTADATSPPSPGVVQHLAPLSTTAATRKSIEAPVTKAILATTPPTGTGRSILSFLNTMAPAGNGSFAYISISGLTELPANFFQPVTLPVVSSVVNSADSGAVASGSLITITGSGLSSTTAATGTLPLPTTLGEICATVNGIPVPLIRVSPQEIDAQAPFEVVGSANLVIIAPGGKSNAFPFTVLAGAPAIFRTGTVNETTGLPLVYRASNQQLVNFSNPLHPGETVVVVLTGLGKTSPQPASGAAAPSDPLAIATTPPVVTLGATTLPLAYAGLIPGSVGVYQINAVVPQDIPSGVQVPLTIQQGSSTTSLPVRVVNP